MINKNTSLCYGLDNILKLKGFCLGDSPGLLANTHVFFETQCRYSLQWHM